MPDEIIYRLPAPIKSGLELPDELRNRGVTEEEYDFYLSKVREAFEEVHGSQMRIFWVCMLVVFVVTIPCVFYYLFKSSNRKRESITFASHFALARRLPFRRSRRPSTS